MGMDSLYRGAVVIITSLLLMPTSPAAADPAAPAYAAHVTRDRRGVTLSLRPGSRAPGTRPRLGDAVVFVPRGFRSRRGRVDLHVHLHGQVTTARKEMRRMRLVRQVLRSRKNVVLVVPQGPVWARKNNWGGLHNGGGLRRLLDGVTAALIVAAARGELKGVKGLSGARRGEVLLSVHSGGYSVAAQILSNSGVQINEVFLFDALFGLHRQFLDWAAKGKGRRLVTFYARRDVRKKHRLLLRLLQERKQPFKHHQRVRELQGKQLTGAPVVVVGSRLGHYTVVHQRGYLRLCLTTSRLEDINK